MLIQKQDMKKIGMTHQAAEYVPQGTEIDEQIARRTQITESGSRFYWFLCQAAAKQKRG